ncbi:hypothetical protein CUJ84_pRLN1000431 (plasmid) [Rhizobium leguminosarum]|uniref:Uncharacterized protein n=1 Tax=Rhizobium leguminosarum TaxID=384 RepID=A0A2K9ZCC7_RHILE|nr:hypothetical protein CUJ84_pRLN1000431 [Rhizobium leguminosarum]
MSTRTISYRNHSFRRRLLLARVAVFSIFLSPRLVEEMQLERGIGVYRSP